MNTNLNQIENKGRGQYIPSITLKDNPQRKAIRQPQPQTITIKDNPRRRAVRNFKA